MSNVRSVLDMKETQNAHKLALQTRDRVKNGFTHLKSTETISLNVSDRYHVRTKYLRYFGGYSFNGCYILT